MNREQIEKWAREADEYAKSQMAPVVSFQALEKFDRIRDEHFARLVRAAALEEAREACEHGDDACPYCIGCQIAQRIDALKEPQP